VHPRADKRHSISTDRSDEADEQVVRVHVLRVCPDTSHAVISSRIDGSNTRHTPRHVVATINNNDNDDCHDVSEWRCREAGATASHALRPQQTIVAGILCVYFCVCLRALTCVACSHLQHIFGTTTPHDAVDTSPRTPYVPAVSATAITHTDADVNGTGNPDGDFTDEQLPEEHSGDEAHARSAITNTAIAHSTGRQRVASGRVRSAVCACVLVTCAICAYVVCTLCA
jgi:hypothetical protein